MASEDFACMLEACPGAYFWIGTDGGDQSRRCITPAMILTMR
jgi:hippurate hydrolase